MTPLNDYHLARLHARFEAPLVVRALLDRTMPIADDEILGLHGLISDLQPDTALIAIALCCQHVATEMATQDIRMPMLVVAADAILNDYGPLWLLHADDHPSMDLYESRIFDLLDGIEEDYESLSDLLTLAHDLTGDAHETLKEIINVLRVQAGSHRLIVHSLLEEMDRGAEALSAPTRTAPSEGNVVSFSHYQTKRH